MDKKPLIILVGADKGGVGKTMVARAVTDYVIVKNYEPAIIDTEPTPGVIKRFWPAARLIDIDDVGGQMEVFDESNKAVITVVDIKASLLTPSLRRLRDAGMFAAAKQGEIDFALLHVLGSTTASLSEMEAVSELVADADKGAQYYVVKNHANKSQFFEWDSKTHQTYFAHVEARMIVIPHLEERACEQLDVEANTHEKFAHNVRQTGEAADYSRMLRGIVRHWLDGVYGEFDNKGLGEQLKR